MKIDKSIIKELSDYLDEFNLTEIEITEKDTKIKVSKNNVSIGNQPVSTSANISAGNENISEKLNLKSGTKITSPIIGTAYHAPEPGAKKFVEIGKKIKKGDTIMIHCFHSFNNHHGVTFFYFFSNFNKFFCSRFWRMISCSYYWRCNFNTQFIFIISL